MALNLTPPDISELKPRITVFGVGGAGGNAVNNMITAGLQGSISSLPTPTPRRSRCRKRRASSRWHRGHAGLGAGSQPDVGSAARRK